MTEGYEELLGAGTEIIQVGPNLLQAARVFFGHSPTPYPFVCDPDKRLYAVYGLDDRGGPPGHSLGGGELLLRVHPRRHRPAAARRVARRDESQFRPPAPPRRHDRAGAGDLPRRPRRGDPPPHGGRPAGSGAPGGWPRWSRPTAR